MLTTLQFHTGGAISFEEIFLRPQRIFPRWMREHSALHITCSLRSDRRPKSSESVLSHQPYQPGHSCGTQLQLAVIHLLKDVGGCMVKVEITLRIRGKTR